jgi:hypothetical protein
MAALVSDFVSDSMWNHTHGSSESSPPQSPAKSPYRSLSKTEPPPPPRIPPSPGPPQPISATEPTPPSTSQLPDTLKGAGGEFQPESATGTGRAPSDHPSSTSSNTHPHFDQQNSPSTSAPYSEEWSSDSKLTASVPLPSQSTRTLTRPARSLDDVTRYGANTIKVRDLAHIRSFASEDFLTSRSQSARRRTSDDAVLKYEISGMPITDIIEMVAGLLTKITTTNDQQHDSLHRPLPYSGDSSHLTGMSSSVLAFHGKNVPSITILSYLSRIHKYCPTTYEVFLSLLVYFDRMTERVNTVPIPALRRDSEMTDPDSRPSTSYSASGSDLADSPTEMKSEPEDLDKEEYTHAPRAAEEESTPFPLSHFFVVDSFNIHRLVISGVTCASKFFSDVFYTNSRYAKVRSRTMFVPLAYSSELTRGIGWRPPSRRT